MNDHPLRQWLCFWRFSSPQQARFLALTLSQPNQANTWSIKRVFFPRSSSRALNQGLDAFERETSNQVLVATFPRIPDGHALEDFTQRTAEAWGVGQSKDDNGVVLFVFPNDRVTRIEVGYGLEGAAGRRYKRIIENEMLPSFRAEISMPESAAASTRSFRPLAENIAVQAGPTLMLENRATALGSSFFVSPPSAHDGRRQSERCSTWALLRATWATHRLDYRLGEVGLAAVARDLWGRFWRGRI